MRSIKKPELFKLLGLRDLEVRTGTAIDIGGLHPFSIYRLTVKAITTRSGKPEEVVALAETKQTLPEVIPAASAIKLSVGEKNVSVNFESKVVKLSWVSGTRYLLQFQRV